MECILMKILPVIFFVAFLTACGEQNEPPAGANAGPEQATTEDSSLDRVATEYQAKVRKKTSDTVVNSLVREWGVSEEKVRCVLGQLKFSQVQQANTDPAAQAVFNECGVDPSVVD
jgi:hypothetical protein